jgi:hypothetical protein
MVFISDVAIEKIYKEQAQGIVAEVVERSFSRFVPDQDDVQSVFRIKNKFRKAYKNLNMKYPEFYKEIDTMLYKDFPDEEKYPDLHDENYPVRPQMVGEFNQRNVDANFLNSVIHGAFMVLYAGKESINNGLDPLREPYDEKSPLQFGMSNKRPFIVRYNGNFNVSNIHDKVIKLHQDALRAREEKEAAEKEQKEADEKRKKDDALQTKIDSAIERERRKRLKRQEKEKIALAVEDAIALEFPEDAGDDEDFQNLAEDALDEKNAMNSGDITDERAIANALTDIAEALKGSKLKNNPFTSRLKDGVAGMADKAVKSLAPGVAGMADKAVKSLAPGVAGMAGKALGMASSASNMLGKANNALSTANALADNLPGMANEAGAAVKNLSNLADKIPGMEGKAGEMMSGLQGKAGDMMSGLQGKAGDMMSGLQGKAGDMMSSGLSKMGSMPSVSDVAKEASTAASTAAASIGQKGGSNKVNVTRNKYRVRGGGVGNESDSTVKQNTRKSRTSMDVQRGGRGPMIMAAELADTVIFDFMIPIADQIPIVLLNIIIPLARTQMRYMISKHLKSNGKKIRVFILSSIQMVVFEIIKEHPEWWEEFDKNLNNTLDDYVEKMGELILKVKEEERNIELQKLKKDAAKTENMLLDNLVRGRKEKREAAQKILEEKYNKDNGKKSDKITQNLDRILHPIRLYAWKLEGMIRTVEEQVEVDKKWFGEKYPKLVNSVQNTDGVIALLDPKDRQLIKPDKMAVEEEFQVDEGFVSKLLNEIPNKNIPNTEQGMTKTKIYDLLEQLVMQEEVYNRCITAINKIGIPLNRILRQEVQELKSGENRLSQLSSTYTFLDAYLKNGKLNRDDKFPSLKQDAESEIQRVLDETEDLVDSNSGDVSKHLKDLDLLFRLMSMFTDLADLAYGTDDDGMIVDESTINELRDILKDVPAVNVSSSVKLSNGKTRKTTKMELLDELKTAKETIESNAGSASSEDMAAMNEMKEFVKKELEELYTAEMKIETNRNDISRMPKLGILKAYRNTTGGVGFTTYADAKRAMDIAKKGKMDQITEKMRTEAVNAKNEMKSLKGKRAADEQEFDETEKAARLKMKNIIAEAKNTRDRKLQGLQENAVATKDKMKKRNRDILQKKRLVDMETDKISKVAQNRQRGVIQFKKDMKRVKAKIDTRIELMKYISTALGDADGKRAMTREMEKVQDMQVGGGNGDHFFDDIANGVKAVKNMNASTMAKGASALATTALKNANPELAAKSGLLSQGASDLMGGLKSGNIGDAFKNSKALNSADFGKMAGSANAFLQKGLDDPSVFSKDNLMNMAKGAAGSAIAKNPQLAAMAGNAKNLMDVASTGKELMNNMNNVKNAVSSVSSGVTPSASPNTPSTPAARGTAGTPGTPGASSSGFRHGDRKANVRRKHKKKDDSDSSDSSDSDKPVKAKPCCNPFWMFDTDLLHSLLQLFALLPGLIPEVNLLPSMFEKYFTTEVFDTLMQQALCKKIKKLLTDNIDFMAYIEVSVKTYPRGMRFKPEYFDRTKKQRMAASMYSNFQDIFELKDKDKNIINDEVMDKMKKGISMLKPTNIMKAAKDKLIESNEKANDAAKEKLEQQNADLFTKPGTTSETTPVSTPDTPAVPAASEKPVEPTTLPPVAPPAPSTQPSSTVQTQGATPSSPAPPAPAQPVAQNAQKP